MPQTEVDVKQQIRNMKSGDDVWIDHEHYVHKTQNRLRFFVLNKEDDSYWCFKVVVCKS